MLPKDPKEKDKPVKRGRGRPRKNPTPPAPEKKPAATKPKKTSEKPAKKSSPDESVESAQKRLVIAKANGEEYRTEKARIELNEARGNLVEKKQALAVARKNMQAIASELDAFAAGLRDLLDEDQCAQVTSRLSELRHRLAHG